MGELRFNLAGLEVALLARVREPAGHLCGAYEQFPSAGRAPDLVIEVDHEPGFSIPQVGGPEYPGFQRRLRAGGEIELSRCDAQGRVSLPHRANAPVRARFRLDAQTGSLDAAVRISTSIALPRAGGLILHSSAVRAGERALVFAGVSGAGKSTISSLLDNGEGATKIADELVAIVPAPAPSQSWVVHLTPFFANDSPVNLKTELAALHFLSQARTHERTRVAPRDALRELLRHVLVYVAEPDTAARVLEIASRLTLEVPCFDLAFAPTADVGEVLGIT